MKQAGMPRTGSATASTGRESIRILLLCVVLVLVAIPAGFMSMLTVRGTFDHLESDRIEIDRNRRQLCNSAVSIGRNQADARTIISNILYRTDRLDTADKNARSLGELSENIRDLRKLLPVESLEKYSGIPDNIASRFAALHCAALNWRTRYDSHRGEISIWNPQEKVRDYRRQLQAANDASAGEQRLHQGQLIAKPENTHNAQAGVRTRELVNRYLDSARYNTSAIRAELIDVGRLAESLANADSLDDLLPAREQHPAPGPNILFQHIGSIEP